MPGERYKIVLIQPPEFPHTAVFAEVARLLHASLLSLGHACEIGINGLRTDVTNILLGYHMLSPQPELRQFPFIVYQLEPLTLTDQRFSPEWIQTMSMARDIWDISPLNIQFLQTQGVQNAKLLPLGYHPALATLPKVHEDIDVLFYGSMNDRRRKVLIDLQNRCRVVHCFGTYGTPRDTLIARSKIVLNLHQLDESRFEQVRISYLLNNSRFVLSEPAEDNPYEGMVATAPYERIAEKCIEYLATDHRRRKLAKQNGDRFEEMRMEDLLKKALA